jgi:hypothetical protein
MEPSALHSQIATYKDGDNCLYFLLGLAQAADELHQLVDRPEPTVTPPAAHRQTPAVVEAGASAEGLHFLLGLLSFFERFRQAAGPLEVGSSEDLGPAPSAAEESQLPASLRDLLR